MNNIKTLSLFQLKIKRKQIIIWTIVLSAIMFMYMILFPSLQDLASIKLDSLPKEFMQLVGVDGFSDLSKYNTYFLMVYSIIMIAYTIFVASFSSANFINEEADGSIEFLASQSVSRFEIFVSKLIISIIALLIVFISLSFVVLLCGYLVGSDTFVFIDLSKTLLLSLTIPLFFMSVATFLSASSYRFGKASFSIFVILVTYLIGYLGLLLESKGEILRYFSPFELFLLSDFTDFNYLSLIIVLVISVLLLVFGLSNYKRRDYFN